MDRKKALTRRDLIKSSAASALALSCAPVLGQLAACSGLPEWKGLSYPRLLLKNFKLFDCETNRLLEGMTVLVERGKIQGVERESDVSDLKGYKVVDIKGKTLLPGLVDAHVHITVPFMYKVTIDTLRQMEDQIALNFKNCIMSGVTTVRDMGGFPGKITKFRELCDSGRIPGPRVISSLSPIAARKGKVLGAPEQAPYFTNPVIKWMIGGNYAERPENVREIRKACGEMIALGAQWLKTLYQKKAHSPVPRRLPNHTDEGYRAIVEIGRSKGIKCALHEPEVSGFIKGVRWGFHTLEHMPNDAMIPEREIERFMKKGMAMVPTMMAFADHLMVEDLLNLITRRGDEYMMPEAVRQMREGLEKAVATMKGKGEWAAYYRGIVGKARANLARMHRMGARIGAGSDIGGTLSGFFGGFIDELMHYSAAGIPNFEVLKMATSVNAGVLGMRDEIGAIRKGARADMIAIDGNPLRDLKALRKVLMVMKGGVFMKAGDFLKA